ncbi:N-acetylneuraminate synthase family protein [Paenibacillus sp. sptzw28]|uniref:N-acetylneuraminate synthase family protein n=1 Tax=Paenibacillus sp. sptzw28 TaxID=715179 RepID=UPI0021624EC6|nr:N-acetylneuraminate synthase family protein [Paenibacillus sp. sptzw28]
MKLLDSYYKNNKCLVIAEVAQAHDGSLGMAHAFIDAVAAAGADAIKFQTHIAEEESTPEEPWRLKFSLQDKTRYDYWKRMEFTRDQWEGLRNHALERKLLFLSSPFSVAAVDLLEELGVPLWKVASGEIMNRPVIDRMIQTGKPILISTGMCTLEELDNCIGWLREANSEYLIFQCTSEYPSPPEKVGLNLLSFYRDRYQCPVGLSDHSGTIYPGIAAAVLGALIIEVHVTFSKQMFGPDISSSITMDQLKELVEGIGFVGRMLSHSVDKEIISADYKEMRNIFYKSLVARSDLPAGTVLKEPMIASKKPGSGISPYRMKDLIGKKLRISVSVNHQFTESDFEN